MTFSGVLPLWCIVILFPALASNDPDVNIQVHQAHHRASIPPNTQFHKRASIPSNTQPHKHKGSGFLEGGEEGEMGSTIGMLLIGGVTFQISLLYLVNHIDPDIKRYSWIIVGETAGIFSAVLLFEGIFGVLE